MENLTHIVDYFDGNLSDAEKLRFNNQIENNTSFAEQVSFYLQSQTLGRIEQKNRFLAQHQSLKKQGGKQIQVAWGRVVGVAAVLVLGLHFLLQPAEFSGTEYANNYIKDNLGVISVQMSANNNRSKQGVILYNEGKYEEALTAFRQDTSMALVLEYQGLCYLQIGKNAEALQTFERLAAQPNILKNKGVFYQALTQMKAGKDTEAKNLLKQIQTNSALFGHQEAKKILE